MNHLPYSFEESTLWANNWIKRCSICVDFPACVDYKEKMCSECTRNPFSICAEDKRDWYGDCTQKAEREVLVKEYQEQKKKRFLEQLQRRKQKSE